MANNIRSPYRAAFVLVPAGVPTKPEGITKERLLGVVVSLVSLVRQLADKMNGGISFGGGVNGDWCGNVDAQRCEFVTPSAPNTTFEVFHGLGRVPVARVVVLQNAAGSLYDVDTGAWTETKIKLRSDVADATFVIEVR